MAEVMENDVIQQDQDANNIEDLHLVFTIEDEDYAINVSQVNDILKYTKLRRVPCAPGYVKGITNVRGDIIPVVCVRSKFMKPDKEPDYETCIIKIPLVSVKSDAAKDDYVGLIVDKVVGCDKIHPANIKAPPNAKLSYANQFIKAIGVMQDKNDSGAEGDSATTPVGKVRMILDLEKLLY